MGDLSPRDPREPHEMRISDADRHQVAEILRQAAGEGRLEPDELDDRLEAAYSAKTYADLVPITADLPVAQQAQPARPPSFQPAHGGPRHDSSLAIMSGISRKGVWEVGAVHNAFTLMGGITLDLRQASFTAPEVLINASTICGGVDITVNAATRVVVEGVGILGSFEERRPKVEPEVGPGSPVVRVRGFALMGSVEVRRKPMPGEKGRGRKMLGH
jgi:hypothetical protein